jgi:hypothetical protein
VFLGRVVVSTVRLYLTCNICTLVECINFCYVILVFCMQIIKLHYVFNLTERVNNEMNKKDYLFVLPK